MQLIYDLIVNKGHLIIPNGFYGFIYFWFLMMVTYRWGFGVDVFLFVSFFFNR